MVWSEILEYLPSALCAFVSIIAFVVNGFKTGSIKKSIESLCPSFEPLESLSKRVDELEKNVNALLSALQEVKK